MNAKIIRMIQNSKAKVIILDIDGTLKDLCKEHTIALLLTLEEFQVSNFRKNMIALINNIAMYMVKTGMVSTNHRKQGILIKMFAILSKTKLKSFRELYFKKYSEQIILFDGVDQLLCLLNSEKEIYFSTINHQNYNLGECGISQKRIVYTEGKSKVETYRKILENTGLDKDKVLVVGDNIFDDILSAKRFGVKCLLINSYDNKVKNVLCRIINNKYLK